MTAPSPSRRVAFAAEVEIRRATPSGLALREEPHAPVALTDAHARREKQIPRVGTTDDVVEPEASPAPAAEADSWRSVQPLRIQNASDTGCGASNELQEASKRQQQACNEAPRGLRACLFFSY